MRFLRILALSAGGFLVGSCSDDGGGGTVDLNTTWIVGCVAGSGGCGSSFAYHDQNAPPKRRFKATCSKVGTVIEFKITDPGADDDPDTTDNDAWAGSEIEVRNGDPARNTCDVTIRDYPNRDAASPLSFTGKCAGNSTMPTCTLAGQFNVNGWFWAGTLDCSGLEKVNASDTARYTLKASAGGPVNIAIDNCD